MSTSEKRIGDIPLGKPLAHGRTADIYAWEDGHVLKLFHNWCDLESIRYEADSAHVARASGLPAPAAGDIIQVSGRYGLIYRRVDGPTMLGEWLLVEARKIE